MVFVPYLVAMIATRTCVTARAGGDVLGMAAGHFNKDMNLKRASWVAKLKTLGCCSKQCSNNDVNKIVVKCIKYAGCLIVMKPL